MLNDLFKIWGIILTQTLQPEFMYVPAAIHIQQCTAESGRHWSDFHPTASPTALVSAPAAPAGIWGIGHV